MHNSHIVISTKSSVRILVVTVLLNSNVTTKEVLLKALTSVGRKNMGDIHQDVVSLVGLGEAILVQASLVGSSHFQNCSRAERSLVVANSRDVRLGTGVIHGIAQGILDLANHRHLRDDAILRSTTSTAFVKHSEAGEVTSGEITGVGIGAGVQIRAELNDTQGAGNAWEGVSTIDGSGLMLMSRVVFRIKSPLTSVKAY